MKAYVLAGGCFWCLDAVFRRLKGVKQSTCGYTGGVAAEANYDRVSTGRTAHVEAVEVSFDEKVIDSEVILDIFFLIHNPTTRDRQGNDVGSQYRSAMFYVDEEQKREFEAAIVRSQDDWPEPIVTDVVQLDDFYPAETEHQNYFTKNPVNGYCNIVIAPKIAKARQAYTRWFVS